jgi:hypothetical protein
MTLFMHFLIGGIMPTVIFVLQLIPSTMDLGDSMRWWFTFIPTFCVGEGIVFSSTYQLVSISRLGFYYDDDYTEPVTLINTDVWAMTNLGGNFCIMVATGIVSTALLVLIEADIFQNFSNFTFRPLPAERHDLDLDDDVAAERDRLSL